MNCPGHIQIFNFGQKSYRDLPLRMAEFGACHRYEPSGALHGIMRVRGFTQDDAHIFCREDQIEAETTTFIRLLTSVYADIGLELHGREAGDASGHAGRHGRGLGQGRGRAWSGRQGGRRAESSCCRATAPSTARSWSST